MVAFQRWLIAALALVAAAAALLYAAGPFRPPAQETAIDAGSVAFVFIAAGFALAILARAGADAQARRLAFGLVASAYALTPILAPNAQWTFELLVWPAIAAGTAAFVRFATSFSATPRALRAAAAPYAAVFAVAYAGMHLAAMAYLRFTGQHVPAVYRTVELVSWPLLFAYGAIALVVTTARAHGRDRARLAWITATFLVSLGPLFAGELAYALDRRAFAFEQATQYALFALPFGLAYAILRHRVVDLGFAITRASVFAVTTGVLVGLFGLAEWGAERLLTSATHAQSLAVEIAIAVALIYAVRVVHERAESFVERMLFAARHRRIVTLRSIAAEVDDVVAEEEIARYVVRRLHVESGIAAALYAERDGRLVLLAGDGEHPPAVGLDDPAVVALRARRMGVHGLPSDLPFADAYPLLVHGRVTGVLACVAAGAGAFAPDEDAALTRLAAAVAVALDTFDARTLREENARLAGELGVLRALVRDQVHGTVTG